jgi:NAD(P)-dependent dehydrogenase (short-subunit alcohol dehydrogenase family)
LKVWGMSAVVTGGASGLGLATARQLVDRGARVVIADLATSQGAKAAADLGPAASFVAADVTSPEQVADVIEQAGRPGELRALVHCAGRGGSVRLVGKDGSPGSIERFIDVVNVNLVGTFNVLRLAAAAMSASSPVEGERGVCVLTASVAAWEGQIGQIPYASAKAGIVGMTLVAARDLASKQIRVCTIAPGLFDTPLLPEKVRDRLGSTIPHPNRLGSPAEYAALALHIIENPMLNGETIRLDGALRMGAR